LSKSSKWEARVFRKSLDYLFGAGTGEVVKSGLTFQLSGRTGLLRHVFHRKHLLGTFTSQGSFAMTPYLARRLVKAGRLHDYSITISDEAVPMVASGRSVFCRHVLNCGDEIRRNSEVAILDRMGNVVAVGRARLPARLIKELKRGVAAKVRKGELE